jgi:hypothetical protein
MDKRPYIAREAIPDWWWIFDPRISLRARAALVFGGAILLLVAFFCWVAGTTLQDQLERNLGRQFEMIAYQASDKIDRTIYERLNELEFIANLAAFRGSDGSVADRQRLLEAMQDSSPDFAWLGFTNPSGRVLASTQGLFAGDDKADSVWFRSAQGRSYAGPPRELPELGRETSALNAESPRFLDLAVPVTDASGQSLGVLGAHLRWNWARDVQFSVLPEGATRDRLGLTVYTSMREPILDSGGTGWSVPPEPPTIANTRRFRGYLRENSTNGTAYLTAFARSRGFKEYRGMGWLATVRQPTELAFAPVRELRLSITRWGLLTVAGAIVASWCMAGTVARRMRSITASANRIRGGDILSVMPGPRDGSEYARMCSALGGMVGDFRERLEKQEKPDKAPDVRKPEDSKT